MTGFSRDQTHVAHNDPPLDPSRSNVAQWFDRWTTLSEVACALTGKPTRGLAAWARTTAGLVVFFVVLQFVTGLLLACYYVPTVAQAHLTVAYIEKAIGGGSLVRALHFYGSQLLPLALVLHLAQMLWRGAERRHAVGWLTALTLLALALAAGATGYSLAWDARAHASTLVAQGILRGLPFLGITAQRWLLGGAELSTLTLSRLYALHALATPALFTLTITARLFVFRERALVSSPPVALADVRAYRRVQLARHATAIAVVFVALFLYARVHPAPLGPPAEVATAGYLPRPGLQFLWLFQLLKYLPGSAASVAALLVPGLLLGGLAALAFMKEKHAASNAFAETKGRPQLAVAPSFRRFGASLFIVTVLLITSLTLIAFIEDRRDPHVRAQLARQMAQEADFRRAPFVPQMLNVRHGDNSGDIDLNASASAGLVTTNAPAPPAAYTQNCAKCHGAHGEGRFANPRLIGISAQPRRSVEDLIALLNRPADYGLEARMPSFATRLNNAQKRDIADWLTALK